MNCFMPLRFILYNNNSVKILIEVLHNPYLVKEPMYQRDCPQGILEVIPNSTCQIFIPNKHCIIEALPKLLITQVLLKATHNII